MHMSRWADWFAIPPDQVDQFADAAGDNEVIEELLEPLLYPAGPGPQPPHVQMDKWWEPIHRCLTGDHAGRLDFDAGDHPLNLCVLGGEPLFHGLGRNYRTAALVYDTEVPEVTRAMQGLTEGWLREQFFRLPPRQFHEIDESACRHIWYCFHELLLPFFARAAAEGQGVVCTISH
jgi:hypothetical protein